MGLTPEQFLQVRRALRLAEVPAKNEAPGKRNSARWNVDAIVGFAACRDTAGAASGGIADAANAEPPAKWVNLIDLSPTGASLLSRSQLAPGEYFLLALPGDGEDHLPAVCLVQHSRVKLDGTFRIGAEFCDPAAAGLPQVRAALVALKGIGLYVTDPAQPAAPTADVQAQAPAQPSEAEQGTRPNRSQRRSQRRMAEGRAVIHTYDEMGEPGPIEEVPALDFSATGVCIFRREPLRVGEHFMARVPLLNARPIISLCRVTNVARCEGENRFRIGAEFVQPAGIMARMAKRFFGMFKAA